MADQMISERIVVSRDVLHGQPRIAGTQIAVVQVLDLLAAGKQPTEICSNDYYPDLNEADILACIAYASQTIRADRVVPTA